MINLKTNRDDRQDAETMLEIKYYPAEPRLLLYVHDTEPKFGTVIAEKPITALYQALRVQDGVKEYRSEDMGAETRNREKRFALLAEDGKAEEVKPMFEVIAQGILFIAGMYRGCLKFEVCGSAPDSNALLLSEQI